MATKKPTKKTATKPRKTRAQTPNDQTAVNTPPDDHGTPVGFRVVNGRRIVQTAESFE